MAEMIHRRSLLRGLFAAPAIVAINSLMPIRGIVMPSGWGGVIRSAKMEALIKGLTDDGIWDKLDNLWLFDGREEQSTDVISGQRFI